MAGEKAIFSRGKYLLEDCLGVGGMGEVYRATNLSLDRKVAIKLLAAEFIDNEDDVLRFLREARAAASVRHPNVVDVIDVARDDDGTPFIVQELLSGQDLEQHLNASGGKISAADAVEIMLAVADGVATAHARKIVHRDLKPANVFLAKEGTRLVPKVLDFGACLYQTVGGITSKEKRMLIGTPHYMAPEQITTRGQVDERVDVWALGIILYELLVGETPFEAENANAVMKLVKTRDVPPLRSVGGLVSEALEQVVLKCTQRERAKRLPDAAAVREQLEAVRAAMKGVRDRIETLPEGIPAAAEAPRTRIPSLRSSRRGSSLLTLSQPGESDPPASKQDPPAPHSVERPIASAPAVDPMPGGMFDIDSTPNVAIDLAAAPRSRPPSQAPAAMRNSLSSLPPVLDPRSALARPTSPPPPSVQSPVPPSLGREPALGPPAQIARAEGTTLSRDAIWSREARIRFGTAIAAPALVAFVALRFAPFTGQLGHALRGDAPLASGVLAVVVLIAAAALAAKTVAGTRDRTLLAAAGGMLAFGITMIIVTFSASDNALGVTVEPGMGIAPFIGPIAPIALGIGTFLRAKGVWLSKYEKGEARLFVVLTSVLLLAALELGPLGPARWAPRAPAPAAKTAP